MCPRAVLGFVAGLVLAASGAAAEAPPGPAPQTPAAPAQADASGKAVMQRKCFQCHQAGMWSPIRQDRRAWQATLFRMVGRGAMWTEAEIAAMATYLAEIQGPAK